MEKMRIKESVPKKAGFLNRLRDRFSRMLEQKKVAQEPKETQPVKSKPVKAEQDSSLHEIIELRPERLIDPVKHHALKVARRTAKRREKEANKATDESKPHKDAFGILLDSQSETDFQAALIEKEEGLDENKPLSFSEIIKDYPIKPQRKLDLHGIKTEEAKIEINSFIRNVRKIGLLTVIIITGKGLHSKDGKSALRDVTEEKIAELKKEGLILNFRWEHQRKKKSGAMIVFLHR